MQAAEGFSFKPYDRAPGDPNVHATRRARICSGQRIGITQDDPMSTAVD